MSEETTAELVKQLQNYKPYCLGGDWFGPVFVTEAAETIARQAAEIERLREALDALLFADEIDDEAVRQGELSVARQDARQALAEAAKT